MTSSVRGPLAVCPRSLSEHPPFRRHVAKAGIDVRWNESGQRLRGDALLEFLDGAVSAVVGVEELSTPPASVRILAKYGVGLDALDLEALEAAGVQVGWTPGVNRHAVAELTLGLLISVFRGFRAARPALQTGALADGRWRPSAGREVRGSTIGVVGCGHVGLEVVRTMTALGARVVVHDLRDRSDVLPEGVAQLSLPALLGASDAVTLHVPLDASTAGLLGAEAIASMRPGAVLINTARGGLVDEAALLEALDAGRLRGAGLDTVAEEPIRPGRLLDHPHVVLTPHVGGSTVASIRAMAEAAWQNLLHPEPVARLRERLAEGRIEAC
jgi:D-3-phosphoglycerate dehydrogenase